MKRSLGTRPGARNRALARRAKKIPPHQGDAKVRLRRPWVSAGASFEAPVVSVGSCSRAASIRLLAAGVHAALVRAALALHLALRARLDLRHAVAARAAHRHVDARAAVGVGEAVGAADGVDA